MPLLQLPLIVEEQMHGQNTLFWMASGLGSFCVAWESSRSCPDDGSLGSATAQVLADPLPSHPSGAVLLPEPPGEGAEPSVCRDLLRTRRPVPVLCNTRMREAGRDTAD